MMGWLMGICSRARPKYIQHVRALYPHGVQQQGKPQNMSAFVHYAVSNPQYLRDIAKYILHRIHKHIRRSDYSKLPIPVAAMVALIEACDALTAVDIFQDLVKASILVLLSNQNYDAKIYGARILACFAKKHNPENPNIQFLGDFFQPISQLAIFDHPEASIQKKVRTEALIALNMIITYNDCRNTVECSPQFLPMIIANISTFPDIDEKSDIDSSSVEGISLECFRGLCQIIKIPDITISAKCLLTYLDEMKWSDQKFCADAVVFYTNNSTQIPNGYNIIFELVNHIKSMRKFALSILNTLAELLLRMKISRGTYDGLIRLLVEILRNIFQESDFEAKSLQNSFLNVIASYAVKMTSTDQLRLVENFCSLLREHNSHQLISQALLEAIRIVSLLRFIATSNNNALALKNNCVITLLAVYELLKLPSPEQRKILINSIPLIILPLKSSDLPVESKSQLNIMLDEGSSKVDQLIGRVLQNDWSLSVHNDLLDTDVYYALRVFIFNGLKNNHCQFSKVHLDILCLTMYFNPQSEVFETLPMILQLLDHSKIDLYSGVVLYLWFMVHVLSNLQIRAEHQSPVSSVCNQLESYLSPFVDELGTLGISLPSGCSQVHCDQLKDWKPENVLNKSDLLNILMKIPLSSSSSESLSHVLITGVKALDVETYLKFLERYGFQEEDYEESKSISLSHRGLYLERSISPGSKNTTAIMSEDELKPKELKSGGGENVAAAFLNESTDDFAALVTQVHNTTVVQDNMLNRVLQTTFAADDGELLPFVGSNSIAAHEALDEDDSKSEDISSHKHSTLNQTYPKLIGDE